MTDESICQEIVVDGAHRETGAYRIMRGEQVREWVTKRPSERAYDWGRESMT